MMDKSGGISLAGGILRAILVLVTGYMTWSFLQTMMGAQAQIVAILGIAAFEGGMIYWEFYFNHVALSSQQTAISASLNGSRTSTRVLSPGLALPKCITPWAASLTALATRLASGRC